jgi:hypothetical protein
MWSRATELGEVRAALSQWWEPRTVAVGGRSSQSRETGGAVGSCCPPLPLGRSLRAASPRDRACDSDGGGGELKGIEAEVAGADGRHVRGRSAGALRRRPARGCSSSKTKDDGKLLPTAPERSCCSAARTLLARSRRRWVGRGSKPVWTKMRPERSLGT